MPVPIIWMVLLFFGCLRAQECLPVVTLNNSTLTQVSEPLDIGNYFEAQVVNPANAVFFKIFPASGRTFRYDFTVTVFSGKCTVNSTGEHIARSKSSSILKIEIPEAHTDYFTAHVVSNNGGSYEIQFCERACAELCLNDCSEHGYCNTTSQECYCFSRWVGETCNTTGEGGRLILFGSRLIGIALFIVVPSLVAIILVICIVSCWFQNKRKDRRTVPVLIYQKFPYELPNPTQKGEDDEGSESQPLISSEKYY